MGRDPATRSRMLKHAQPRVEQLDTLSLSAAYAPSFVSLCLNKAEVAERT